MHILLLLKANPFHDRLGRFAHAPEGHGEGSDSDVVPIVRITGEEIPGEFPAIRDATLRYAEQHYIVGRDEHGRRLPLKVTNLRTGAKIGISYQGVKHASGFGWYADHLRMVAALPDLLRYAFPLPAREDRKGRPDIPAIHPFLAPVDIGGRRYIVRLVVRETSKGHLYYDHALTGLLPISMSPALTSQDHIPGGGPGDVIKIGDILSLIKNGGTLAKALAAGERWITVHPNGPGTDGQPVLIRQMPDGAAKVIGGAGGRLNHLRLMGVRSEAEYKESVRRAADARRADRRSMHSAF
jgi:hypothetical protein